jgi:phage terminase large subunit-like protein
MSAALGLPFMPWQDDVAAVAGEMVLDDITGLWVPAYPEVIVTVPRQSGKTTVVLSAEMDRMFNWGRLQHVVYTAQTGTAARRKFVKDQLPLIRRSKYHRQVLQYHRAADNTGLTCRNDSTLTVWATSDDAGHGSTVDLGVLDEIFADEDDRREQATIPAMATRADAQKLITSTAGTVKSQLLDRKQAAGRHAVDTGRTDGIAYFEWSAVEGDDPGDPNTWRKCMPALGYTITERTVRQAYDTMPLAEFMRAWLNIPNRKGSDRVIPKGVWDAVCVPDFGGVTLGDDFVFGVDGTPDQSAATIVAADGTGRVEVVEHRAGTGWIQDRLVELAGRYQTPVAVDRKGPVGYVIEALRNSLVNVVEYDTSTYGYACSRFYRAVAEGHIQVLQAEVLDLAVEAAKKRPVGDQWVWARKTVDTDISSLVAATLAYDAAQKPVTDPLANIW